MPFDISRRKNPTYSASGAGCAACSWQRPVGLFGERTSPAWGDVGFMWWRMNTLRAGRALCRLRAAFSGVALFLSSGRLP